MHRQLETPIIDLLLFRAIHTIRFYCQQENQENVEFPSSIAFHFGIIGRTEDPF